MQANKKLFEMGWLEVVVGRVVGVLLSGGEEGVVGPRLCSSERITETSADGGWMVLASGVVPPASIDLVEYINLPTTSKLNNLLEDFSLWAYLNMKR